MICHALAVATATAAAIILYTCSVAVPHFRVQILPPKPNQPKINFPLKEMFLVHNGGDAQ